MFVIVTWGCNPLTKPLPLIHTQLNVQQLKLAWILMLHWFWPDFLRTKQPSYILSALINGNSITIFFFFISVDCGSWSLNAHICNATTTSHPQHLWQIDIEYLMHLISLWRFCSWIIECASLHTENLTFDHKFSLSFYLQLIAYWRFFRYDQFIVD